MVFRNHLGLVFVLPCPQVGFLAHDHPQQHEDNQTERRDLGPSWPVGRSGYLLGRKIDAIAVRPLRDNKADRASRV